MLGFHDRLVILMYHRVFAEPDPYHADDVSAEAFNWQLAVLKRYFNVLPLTEAAERLKRNALPARTVCITFDDGYADNVDVALPILQRHQLHATFFIATGYLDGGRMWNDTVIEAVARASGATLDLSSLGLGTYAVEDVAARLRAIKELLARLKYLQPVERLHQSAMIAAIVGQSLPNNLMMTTHQLQMLDKAGMGIGAHTMSHPILALLPDEASRAEIEGSIQRLGELLSRKIQTFAYPNGRPGKDYGRKDVDAVRRAGIQVGVSTAWGYANATMDNLQLARIAPWDTTPTRFALRIFRSYFGAPPTVL